MKLKIYTLLLILTLLPAVGAKGGRTILSAKLDSATMLMGNVNTLHLEVVQDKGVKGDFPIFRNIGESKYVTLLNDTVELSSKMKIDTTDIGSGRIQINWHVPVQVFDSGYYKLPEFVYVAGRDSIKSNSLTLTVVPVKVKADDAISPLTDVAEPEDSSIFDSIPDWLYYYWWVIVLAVLLAAAAVWLYRRYRTVGTILPPKPITPPYELALERLGRLKARKLWENGQEKEFYTILTDILRTYLDGRFGIKAMEMTSREIMSTLADDPTLRDSRSRMRQILDMADFVKFAMVRPLPDDNVKAFDNAVEFVEQTKPVVNPESEKGENTMNGEELTASAPLPESLDSKHKMRIVRDKHKKKRGGEA